MRALAVGALSLFGVCTFCVCCSIKACCARPVQVIDLNFYPVPEARYSNMRHRPVGMGVQGLADTFIKMRMPFESPEAAALNKDIFETMYFAALDGVWRLVRCLL